MYPDLSAFGRATFPALGAPVPVGETGGGGMGEKVAMPAPPVQQAPTASPYQMMSSQAEPAPLPILVPDPALMAEQANAGRMHLLLKYGIIGLLGAVSGLLVASQIGKSKMAGAGIGGLGSVGILLLADFIKFSQNVSSEISPLFVPEDV